MNDEQLEVIRSRKAAKDAEKKKKAEEEKAAKGTSQVIQKKDKHVAVEEDNPPQPLQQPLKRGRSSASSTILESIPPFTVNNSEDFNMAMDHIIGLANAAKSFVRIIGDVESWNVALEMDLSQKNKLIAEGKTELLRLQSTISDLEEARTASADVIKNLRASETKLKEDLQNARKETEDVRETAKKEKTEMAAEFAAEKEELEEEVLGGVEDGYERCLRHIRATVPELDLSEFAWNSLIVDGKVKREQSAPPA